jgi:fluoroquinolone transport system permease protein
MTRVIASLRWEMTLQFRYGFYYVGAFIVVLWVLLLNQLTLPRLDLLVPAFVVSGMLITTYYFIGALVLLEKAEGVLQGLVVSPLRDTEYLAAKVGSLVLLAVVESLIVVVLGYGARFSIVPLVAGMVFTATIFTLLGFVAIARYDSINEYLMPSVLFLIILTAPLIDHLGIWRSWLFYLHPFQPPLLLMRSAFVPLAWWQVVYGLAGSLLWVVVSFAWARRLFHQFVVRTAGS